MQPLIVTLKIDDGAFCRLDELRRQYFPPKRNLVPAHLTLFHNLPGEHEDTIQGDLEMICSARAQFELDVSGLRFLGRGVAIDVHSRDLLEIRSALAKTWSGWLTPQDRQSFRPHVTISNKLPPETAKELYRQLQLEFEPVRATGAGLSLWRYLGGPWSLAQDFSFSTAGASLPAQDHGDG